LETGELGQDVTWRATIIEARRINGKPRQHHVCYLGSITESGIVIKCQRGYFWKEVSGRLDRLANRMTESERTKIEVNIARKVPPITPQELEECIEGGRVFREQLRAMIAGLR
jgi:hypothetical protein